LRKPHIHIHIPMAEILEIAFVSNVLTNMLSAAGIAGHMGDIAMPEINPQAGALILLGFGLIASLVAMNRAHV